MSKTLSLICDLSCYTLLADRIFVFTKKKKKIACSDQLLLFEQSFHYVTVFK